MCLQSLCEYLYFFIEKSIFEIFFLNNKRRRQVLDNNVMVIWKVIFWKTSQTRWKYLFHHVPINSSIFFNASPFEINLFIYWQFVNKFLPWHFCEKYFNFNFLYSIQQLSNEGMLFKQRKKYVFIINNSNITNYTKHSIYSP